MDKQPWKSYRNRFKDRLTDGGMPVAMWVTIPWPPIVEILGCTDLDAAFFCLEHTSYGLDVVEQLIARAELAGITPIVRPSHLDPHEVGRILDAGAQGIVFPHIDTPDDAELARRSLEYPPNGIRGWAGAHVRYARWQGGSGVRVLRSPSEADRGVYSTEYVEKSRSDLLSIFIVETAAAVRNIEEILDRGRPDLLYFGWGDYSVEVSFDFDQCVKAADRVYRIARERGVGVSVAPGQGSMSEPYPGCYTIVGNDALITSAALASAVERATTARATFGQVSEENR
jgi:2-keto-3-deoxy-L-rhamnonate aldolase RhmA